jgi:hypothetical protein
MSDEVVASAQAEPVTDATAATVDSPVEGAETQPEALVEQVAKTFTQDEVDAIVGQRLARESRKSERDIQAKIDEAVARQLQQRQQPQEAPQKPKPDQFTTTEDYVEALTDWKAREVVKSQVEELRGQEKVRTQKAQAEQIANTYRDRVAALAVKHPDFEEVAYSPSLPITDAMAETIQQSELGAEVHYFLGKNPAEAKRIASLSPFLQAKEIGRIEAKLASGAPLNVSSAPKPITPVGGGRGAPITLDLDDPASLKKMGTSAWIEANRERQRQAWKAKQG